MSSLPLWLALEPELSCTKLLLSHSSDGTLLKARLSATPAHPGALAMLLESLSAWQGMPLYAVLDADAEGVSKHPECWARLMGEAEQHHSIHVEWSSPAPAPLQRRNRELEEGFGRASQLLVRTFTGQR